VNQDKQRFPSATAAGGGSPRLSVVVASFREPRLLHACLASVLPQCEASGAELIVARSGPAEAEVAELVHRHPFVRVVWCSPGAKVPELRAAGLRAASGDIVALTEDHCVVADDWLAQLEGCYRTGADVVGGAMRNAQQRRSVDWGAYFAEYGFFSAASVAAASPALTGANVAYGRAAAAEVADLAGEGAWENVAHARLAERGRTLLFLESAVVAQNQNYRFVPFCRDRYEHGRDYARVRLDEEGTSRRWVYLAGTVALPFLLTWRVARLNAAREPGSFLRALPYTFAFLSAWSVGELAGYWRGPGVEQASHV
jgi:glycosyltransferase involved in cell wall biosynthesis